MPVLELADIEIPVGLRVFRIAKKNIARGLHRALAVGDAAPLVHEAGRRGGDFFEDRRPRLFDLQKDGLAIRRHEKPDGTKGADAADADDLEGNVGQRIALDQRAPLGKQGGLVIGEGGMRVNFVVFCCLGIEMIDQGRPVLDMRTIGFRRREMRKIIVRRQIFFGFHQDRKNSFAEFDIGDPLDLLVNVHARVPDFERRLGGELEDEFTIGFDGGCREGARLFVRHLRVESRDRDAGRESLQIDGEIDAGQSLVEIIDVEEDTFFRRVERTEIHQMAVPAGLQMRANLRNSGKIMGHHGGGAPQEGEGRLQHAFVADWQQFRNAGAIGLGENGDRVAAGGRRAFGMGFAGHALAQRLTEFIAFGSR